MQFLHVRRTSRLNIQVEKAIIVFGGDHKHA